MKHPLTLALAAAVAVTLTACGTPGTPTASTTTTTTTTVVVTPETTAPAPSQPAPQASACEQLKGTVTDGTCTVHEETARYTIDITFPADYPDQQAIADLMTKQRDGFLEIIAERPDRENPYALDIKGTEYRSASPETVSVVFLGYSEWGGAHPITNYDALSYDLAADAPLTFEKLFKPGSDPVATLDPIVQQQLTQRFEGVTVGPNPNGAQTYRSFALTDDALLIFLSQGAWLFSAGGPIELSIPRSELADVLA